MSSRGKVIASPPPVVFCLSFCCCHTYACYVLAVHPELGVANTNTFFDGMHVAFVIKYLLHAPSPSLFAALFAQTIFTQLRQSGMLQEICRFSNTF